MIDALLIAAAMIGVCAAAFLVARSPTFWLGMAGAAFKAAWPYLLKFAKPASPEELKRQKANTDRGQESGAVGNGPANKWGRRKGE